jgi:glycine C-acetyltransferase
VTAACLAALDILESEPQWIEKLWDNTRFFKAGLDSLGFNTGMSESPITPVIVGEAATRRRCRTALRRGVFARASGSRRSPRQGQAEDHRRRDPHQGRPAVRSRHLGRVGRELGVI